MCVETESPIFIFLMLQYANTSERSRDAAIVRMCCRDFRGSLESFLAKRLRLNIPEDLEVEA